MRRALTAAAVATAGAALAGGASAGPAPGAGPAEPVVMAQIAGGTSHAAEVAARTGLTLEGTLPTIGWATYAEGADAAAARLRLLRDPAVTRIDFVAPGERQVPRLRPARHHLQLPGNGGGGRPGRGRLEVALDQDELPGGVGHLARKLRGEGRGDRQ